MPLHLLDNLTNLSNPDLAKTALGLGTGDSPTFNNLSATGTVNGLTISSTSVSFPTRSAQNVTQSIVTNISDEILVGNNASGKRVIFGGGAQNNFMNAAGMTTAGLVVGTTANATAGVSIFGGLIEQRNGLTPQESRIYGTYSESGANYERFFVKTNTGGATQIGLSAAGTGSYRDLEFQNGGSTRMTITSAGNIIGYGAANRLPNQTADTSDSVLNRELGSFETVLNGNEFRQMVAIASQLSNGGVAGTHQVLGMGATAVATNNSTGSVYTFDGVHTHSTFSGALMRTDKQTEAYFHGVMLRVEANQNYVLRINFGVGGPTRVPPAAGTAAASARQWGVEFYYNGTNYVGRLYYYDTSIVYGSEFIIPLITAANWIGLAYSMKMTQSPTGLLQFYMSEPTVNIGSPRIPNTAVSELSATWTSTTYAGRHINFEAAAAATAAPAIQARIHASTMFVRYVR